MDRDTELTVYLLRYLLENRFFHSKEEMAEIFDVSKRQIQRLMNAHGKTKGGTIALNKIVNYFGLHQIPFDPVLARYLGFDTNQALKNKVLPAYQRIQLHCSGLLDTAGVEAINYCCNFIGMISRYICPSCIAWCDPWSATTQIEQRSCLVAWTAKTLIESIELEYTKRT